MTASPESLTVAYDDNRAVSALVGPYGQNLALIERKLNVMVDSRGNHITVAGTRDGCETTRRVLDALYAQAQGGHELAQGDVDGAIRAVLAQGSLFEYDAKVATSSFDAINLRKRPVTADELERLVDEDDVRAAVFEVHDRFGEYGIVGLVVARANRLELVVETLLLNYPQIEAGEGAYPSVEAALSTAAAHVDNVYRRYNAQVARWQGEAP